MIGDLMLYATKVSLLIAIAALVLERVAAWRALPRRGVWAVALMLSLALPALGVLMPGHVTAVQVPVMNTPPATVADAGTVVSNPLALDTARSSFVQLAQQRPDTAEPVQAFLETVLLILWAATSAGLVIFYALAWFRLRLAARSWQRMRLNEQPVWVTEGMGPAVTGIIQPAILIPRWVLDAPERTRNLIVAHEQEHIAARDPALLLLGLVLVAIAPWNPLLWWQLRRLRFAIEVDCDARILRRGEESGAYGEVLLAVGKRHASTPIGAIALIEPASQLLRRIRIMTSDLPRRSAWAVSAALGLTLASLAVAAQFQAPSLPTGSSSRDAAEATLRKLPPLEDPRQEEIRALARTRYPELFDASARPGAVLVTMLLNQDGSLYKSHKEDIEPTPWIQSSVRAFEAMGAEYQHGGGIGVRMQGSPTARNRVDIHAWYRELPADSTRDVATVRAKVRERFASHFRPMHTDGAHRYRQGSSVVTVFMTEGGDIDRAQVDVSEAVEVDKDVSRELEALATPERFAEMGISSQQIGLIGTTTLFSGQALGEPDLKTLQVIYAWPRRTGESGPKRELPGSPEVATPGDDPTVNAAIAERYFPDLYTHPKKWPRADPWVLLDRQGEVMTTGRRVAMSARDFKLYIESLYPGLRTDEVQVTTIHGERGESSDMAFVWLAADSPVDELSKADLSRRGVVLYADIVGEGKTRSTELMTLQAGSPALTKGALANPFGVVHVEVTPEVIGTDSVTLRMRIQHAPVGIGEDIPAVIATGWSARSAPITTGYGGATNAEVSDQNGKTWTVVLHPERLGTTGS